MAEQSEAEPASSFIKYPSIGQLKDVPEQLPYVNMSEEIMQQDTLTYEGTVKLHGCNCSVVSRLSEPLQYQSRHLVLSPEADGMGFYKWAAERQTAIEELLTKLRSRCTEEGSTLVLFGEFCGPGIQKGVGITQQPDKFFVIFNVRSESQWVPPELWEDLSSPESGIYVIRSFARYEQVLSISNVMAGLASIDEVTEQVGRDCPVARALGTPGPGEGIVWIPKEVSSSRLWFKSKCQAHAITSSVRKAPKITKASPVDVVAQEFVAENVTEARLCQGLDYMREFGIEKSMSNLGVFVKWVCDDVLREEGSVLTEECQKKVKKLVANKCVTWFKKQCA